jgi:hypothetical protein
MTQQTPIVSDELVKAAEEASRFIADLVRCRSYGGLYVKETNHALQAALTLPRTTIEEAEARGAAKERERLAKIIGGRFCGGEIIAEAIRSQDNN